MGGTSPVGINAGRLTRSLIEGNSFLGNSTGESGIVIGANSNDIKIGQQKFTSIADEWNVSASATNINFYGGIYESKTASGSTSNAYGSFFATPTINISFTEQIPSIPRINLRASVGGGVLSASATSITSTGFQLLIYGVTNNGSVSVDWDAFF